jgi:hypothetical protein
MKVIRTNVSSISLSVCNFSFGTCVVCSSSIYWFWLPLWCLQTLLSRGMIWSVFDSRLLITSRLHHFHYICPTRYDQNHFNFNISLSINDKLHYKGLTIHSHIAIVVWKYTDSDYLCGVFKLFLVEVWFECKDMLTYIKVFIAQ